MKFSSSCKHKKSGSLVDLSVRCEILFHNKGYYTAGQSPAPAAYGGFPQQSCGVLNPIFPHSLDHAHAGTVAILAHFVNKTRFRTADRLIYLLFTTLLLTSLMFTGCAKQQVRQLTIEEGVLSVGVEIGYPPMEYYAADGITLAGFDIELTKALADKLGLKIKYIDTAWEGILAGLDTGKYDMAINITILPERQKRHNFTKPYINSSMTIVTLRDSFIKIKKPEDIAGYSIGYQSDTTAQYFAQKLRDQGIGFSSFAYDKILNCFDDLKLKRLDAVAVDNIVAFDYAGKKSSPFEVSWQGTSGEQIGICLKKGNDALTVMLNNALDELFLDGVMLRISQKVFGRDLVSSVR